MRFVTAPTLTHIGGRQTNEDCAGWTAVGGQTCWALADGLGGHAAGEIASEVAVEAALAAFRTQPGTTPAALNRCMAAAQRLILQFQAGQSALRSMRTTLVVLVTDAMGVARWSHVGDSRLYVFRDGSVVRQTADHSLPQALVEAGQIGPADVRRHPDRNRLLRALGSRSEPNPEVSEAFAVQPGDAFLLCTDGFWELVEEPEMAADLATASTPAAWLSAMEGRLRERAAGDHDNYTALAVCADV